MSKAEDQFVNQYTSATTTATTLGYQVLSLIGGRVGSVLSFNKSPSSHLQSPSKDRRRPLRSHENNADLPILTLEEISCHDTPDDCWMIIYDRVYDVTDFLNQHPGGEDVMLEFAGRDATLAFRGVGHSNSAELSLKPYLIGILTESERIWTRYHNMNADPPSSI